MNLNDFKEFEIQNPQIITGGDGTGLNSGSRHGIGSDNKSQQNSSMASIRNIK